MIGEKDSDLARNLRVVVQIQHMRDKRQHYCSLSRIYDNIDFGSNKSVRYALGIGMSVLQLIGRW